MPNKYQRTEIEAMHRAAVLLHAELAASDVTHIDVREYAVGSPRWEKLWREIAEAQRYRRILDYWEHRDEQ